MAASMRARLLFSATRNVSIRSNTWNLQQPCHSLYQNKYGQVSVVNQAKDLTSNVLRRQLTTSTVRWNEINDETTTKTYLQEEPSEAELLQSIEYMQSEEYLEKYGDRPVWANYKRNHKGRLAPMKTRKRCIRGGGEKERVCGNPCPVCRDPNLVLHYQNAKLLEQFICPHSWNIYSTFRTGLCQRQFKKLCATIEKARVHGVIQFSVPFIEYKYEDFSDCTHDDEQKASEKV